jgi:hypothetical protein
VAGTTNLQFNHPLCPFLSCPFGKKKGEKKKARGRVINDEDKALVAIAGLVGVAESCDDHTICPRLKVKKL